MQATLPEIIYTNGIYTYTRHIQIRHARHYTNTDMQIQSAPNNACLLYSNQAQGALNLLPSLECCIAQEVAVVWVWLTYIDLLHTMDQAPTTSAHWRCLEGFSCHSLWM